MTITDPRTSLRQYLQEGRDAMLWKLEGLSEYDVRRPLTPTGTNLLGLVKHLALVETGYFGETFERPFPDPPLFDPDELNADMWATAEESREQITGMYRRAWVHSDETISDLDLDARGHVPWWRDHGDVTLYQVLVHVIAETHRHAGHADIVRELIDGSAGLLPARTNLPDLDEGHWERYRAKLEEVARQAR